MIVRDDFGKFSRSSIGEKSIAHTRYFHQRVLAAVGLLSRRSSAEIMSIVRDDYGDFNERRFYRAINTLVRRGMIKVIEGEVMVGDRGSRNPRLYVLGRQA